MRNNVEELLVRFVQECGGVEFVRMIASGRNPCDDQKIVAAAKAAIGEVQLLEENVAP